MVDDDFEYSVCIGFLCFGDVVVDVGGGDVVE